MNVKITVPLTALFNPESTFGQPLYQEMVSTEGTSEVITIDGINCIATTVESVPDIIFRSMVTEMFNKSNGYNIQWLTQVNEPWVNFNKKIFNPAVANSETMLKGDMVLMPMYIARDGIRLNDVIGGTDIDPVVLAYATDEDTTGGDDDVSTDGLYSDPLTLEGLHEEYDHGDVC